MSRKVTALVTLVVGLLSLIAPWRPAAAFTQAEAKAPMTVTLVRSDAPDCGADCPEWLALTGKIGFETPSRLAAALARLGKRRVPILLDSPGGESLAGLAMGRMVRARGLDTAVATTVMTTCYVMDEICQAHLRRGEHSGHVAKAFEPSVPACASACVLVLAGGVDRAVPPGAYVGVHQAKQVVTFHPVMHSFRILSRIVNGRKVEISRTLVSSRPLPVRVVTSAAPQSIYSAFDRYLLGLGIDESIMPLMRATPSSGIHWLTTSELATTRVSTDTVDIATLVSRESDAQAAADRHSAVPLVAALTLNDARRWTGFVTWRIDAATPGVPALVADWEVPRRHLQGSVTITATDAPGVLTSFKIVTRFTSGAGSDAARILTIQTPRLCDSTRCMSTVEGNMVSDRPAATFDVVSNWRSTFLSEMRQLSWFRIFVRTGDGEAAIDLPLASSESLTITDWARLCCGFDTASLPASTSPTALPDYPAHPEPSFIAGIGPVQPATGTAKPSPRTLDLPALFDEYPVQQHGYPTAAHGSMTWFPLGPPTAVAVPGTVALLGTAELPAVGLRVSLDIGTARAGMVARLTLRLHILTEDPGRFGPLKSIFAFNAFDDLNRPLLRANDVAFSALASEQEVHLDVPSAGPIAGAIQVGFEDITGRRVTLAFQLDPAVAALLQAASRSGGQARVEDGMRSGGRTPAPVTSAPATPRA